MVCEAARARFFAYLDAELPAEERRDIDEHVASCPECRHRLELEHAFREIYMVPLRPDPAPPEVRARAARLLASLSAPRLFGRAWWARFRPVRGRRLAVAAGSVLVVTAALASAAFLAWTQQEASASLTRLADASVEQHQKLARGVLPFDVAQVSPRDAEQWFATRLDFNVRLPELKAEHLQFLGGRISHLRDFEVAALEYRVDDKNVSLFIMPSEQYQKLGLTAEPKFKMVNRHGYDVIVWTAHGAAYALVSEIGGRSCTVCHSPEERLDVTLEPEIHRVR